MMKVIASCLIGILINMPLLAQTGIQIPYCDNFDSTSSPWTAFTALGSPWEHGSTVVGGFPLTTYSSPNVWAIGLTSGTYVDECNTYLISPEFTFTGMPNAILNFWYNSNTELTFDGTWLEFSYDSTNWNILGIVNDPNGTNWYNDILNYNGIYGWSGNSVSVSGNQNGWVLAKYVLGNIIANAPSVWFRFVFSSDPSISVQGFAIDNFCIDGPPDIDAAIVGVNGFNTVNYAGSCVTVSPVLQNFGGQPLSQTTINYSINGGPVESTPWTGNLLTLDQEPVQVNCFTVPYGTYEICFWTSTPGDTLNDNDTLCLTGQGIQNNTSNICHDFEVNNGGFYTIVPNSQWEYGTPNFGITTGAHSGINAWDISLDSAYITYTNEILYSGAYHIDSLFHPILSFWHNRSLFVGNDGYYLQYKSDNDTVWNKLGTMNDPNGLNWNACNIPNTPGGGWNGNSNGWQHSLYLLNNLIGVDSTIQFRIIFLSGNTYSDEFDGVSIDDFCVYHAPQVDVAVTKVIATSGFHQMIGLADTLGVTIRNLGATDLTATDIYYSIDGGAAVGPYSWTGILPPGIASGNIQLTTNPLITIAGNSDICVWTQTPNDNNFSNDTNCVALFGISVIPVSFGAPYCNDFENSNLDWYTINSASTQNTLWQWGTPTYGTTTGAHSGMSCWDINLESPYLINSNTALYSPVFQMPINANPILNFYQSRNTETFWDGVRLEYSINGGTWTLLGGPNTPTSIGTNWYNVASIGCSSQPAWGGNSGGWIFSEYKDLVFMNGQNVQFRFIFCSDPSVIDDGFSIDDFCLTFVAPVSASPANINIINSYPYIFPGNCYSFTSEFINTGADSLGSLNVILTVDGVPVSSDSVNFNPALSSGSTSNTFTFNNCWIATAGTHTVCAITSNPNGGVDNNMDDDTVCFTVSVLGQYDLTTGNSYCQDFESSQAFLSVNALTYSNISSWEYGLPTKTFLNDANSGNKAWITDLTQLYPANDNSALLTETFTLNTNTPYKLSFYTKFKTEFMNDGGTIQYTTDFANTWQTLGDNTAAQWMNTANIIAINPTPPPNIGGWSGTSGWQLMQHPLCFPSTQGTIPMNVMFRFLFRSDVFTQDEGWEIDDFCIEPDSFICTVGIPDDLTSGQFYAYCAPNPSWDNTNLYFTIPASGNVSIFISDITGKVVKKEEAEFAGGLHSLSIQTVILDAGVYFYTVQWNEKGISGKLLVSGK